MRNWMLVSAIFIVSVTFGAKNSSAQTDLTLQLTSTGALPILFTTSGISISQNAKVSNSWNGTVVSGLTNIPNLQPLYGITANFAAKGFKASVPEPNAMLLFGTGLLAVGGILRRRLGLA